MRGLQTARALIVENTPADAAGMLQALGLAGIGAVYLSGAAEDLPTEPWSGLRLVLLDMYLDTAEHEPEAAAASVLAILDEVLAEDNGPYVVVTWSTNDDAAEHFRDLLPERLPPSKHPVATLKLQKADFKADGNYQPQLILDAVKAKLDDLAFLIVVDWEQLVHDAATSTTSGLLPVQDDGAIWTQSALSSLAALAKETVPASQRKATPPDGAVFGRGLLAALEPLHLDNVEQQELSALSAPDSAAAFAAAMKDVAPTAAQASSLNSRLLLGPPQPMLWPGHIYRLEEVFKHTAWCEQDYDQFLNQFYSDLLGQASRADGEPKQDFRARCEQAPSRCQPIAVEASPACDVMNGKLMAGRLVLGALVPHALTVPELVAKPSVAFMPETPARKLLGPLRLGAQAFDGPVHIALHARYVSGCDPTTINDVRALGRLRETAASDIQAWVTSQGGRLGLLQVTMPR